MAMVWLDWIWWWGISRKKEVIRCIGDGKVGNVGYGSDPDEAHLRLKDNIKLRNNIRVFFR